MLVLNGTRRPRAAGGGDAIPARVAGLRVVLGKGRPVGASDTVHVVHDFAVPYGDFADQALLTGHSGAVEIRKPEVAVVELKDGDIGGSAHRKIPELFAMNFAGRIPC